MGKQNMLAFSENGYIIETNLKGSDLMTIGEKIQYYRKQAKLSQEELGRMLLLSRQTVSLWETGQTVPTIDNLIRLKEIFGVSIDEILCQETKTAQKKEENPPAEICIYRYTDEDWNKRKKTALRTFRKPILLSCVLALIGIFLIFSYSGALSAILFGILILPLALWSFSYSANKKMWQASQTRMMETEYRYEIYADCLIARFFRNEKNVNMIRIPYSEITQLSENETYYLFSYERESHCIYKKHLKENSLLPTIFENCSPAQKILPRKKPEKSTVISLSLFAASICAPFLALVFASLLTHFNDSFLENMWTFLALLPIPIASFIYGIHLCSKKKKGVRNIIVGIVIIGLLTVWGSFVFLF